MKATIREHVPGKGLAEAVPPLYRDEIIKAIDPQSTYTLVLCAHNPRDVNLSSQLERAFKRVALDTADKLIVVGAAFTAEAKALAATRGAQIISFHKTTWTDESARQRQL
jgi:hypothetical protein